MKRHHGVGHVKKSLIFLMFLVTAFFIAMGVGEAGTISSCSGCHGMPPKDDTFRNYSSGGFVGNHSEHLPASAVPNDCVKCHGSAVTTYTYSHRGAPTSIAGIHMNSNVNTSPATGTYSKGVFFNQTSVPALGSCSNVNCHFENTTPTWGNTPLSPLSFATDCSVCHGAPPADGSHPVAGSKHGKYFGTNYAACVKCHPDHTVEAKPFQHATSAGSRALVLQFTAAPNTGTGSYSKSADLNYPNYLPSQTAAASRNGYCSNIYCHSNGQSASAPFANMSTPQWGGSLTCDGCHGYTAASGKMINTNAHAKHINNATVTGKLISCQDCHNATTADGTTINATTGYTDHVNKSVNIKFNNADINKDTDAPTYNAAATTGADGYAKAVGNSTTQNTCSNVYCHSAGKTDGSGNLVAVGGTTFRSMNWNGASIGCDGCHGNQAGKAHPVYASGAVGSTTANSHVRHVEGLGYNCETCHTTTTASTTIPPTSVISGGTHLNRSMDVAFDAAYNRGGSSYNGTVGTKSCSNIYCHSDGNGGNPNQTPQWGGSVNCRSCHAGDVASGTPMSTGKHRDHIDATYAGSTTIKLGAGNAFQCATCHSKTIATFANNTTITNAANHVNGFKDYSSPIAGGSATYNTTKKSCSTNYCHSNGNKNAIVYNNMTGAYSWTGSATLGCNGCHGNDATPDFPTSATGAPNYASTGSGTTKANSHKKHVYQAGMVDTTGCANCHAKTVDVATASKFKDYTAAKYHINGTPDISFRQIATGITGTFNADQSCSNTYCHGTSASPKWGETSAAIVPLACDKCHSASAGDAGWSTNSAHKIHWEDTTTLPTAYNMTPGNSGTATTYRFACSSCHDSNRAQHASGPANGNRAAQVFFGYTTAGKNPTYADGGAVAGTDNGFNWTNGGSTTCNNTYCHSDGNGNPGRIAVTWNTTTKTADCTACHGGTATSAFPITSGKHAQHTNNTSANFANMKLSCVECHAKTLSADTTIGNKLNHVNKFKDYSGAKAYKSSLSAGSCSSTYCHSNGKVGTTVGQNNTVSWTTASTTLTCNSCHGTNTGAGTFVSQYGEPNYASGAAGSATSNSHQKHVDVQGITCNECHNNTAASNTALKAGNTTHLNQNTQDIAFGGFSSSWRAAAYNTSARSCSNITCHSNGRGVYQSPAWGQTDNCGFCHPISSLSATHAKHVDLTQTPVQYTYTGNHSTATAYNFGCSSCHPLTNNLHTTGTVLLDLRPNVVGVGTLRSKNSTAITVGSVVAGTAGSGTIGTPGVSVKCQNVYCHSNGYASNPVYATTPDWYGGAFANEECDNCHGNSPNSNIVGSAAHSAHVVGIHYDGIYGGGTTGIVPAAGTTGLVGHGVAVSGAVTTINCNVCHNNTVTSSANDLNLVCATCHGATKQFGATAHGNAAIANKAFHVNGRVDIAFVNQPVATRAQLRAASFATYTATGGAWTRVNSYKTSTSYDQSKTNLYGTATFSGGSCSNVACHNSDVSMPAVNWYNDVGSECTLCHRKL